MTHSLCSAASQTDVHRTKTLFFTFESDASLRGAQVVWTGHDVILARLRQPQPHPTQSGKGHHSDEVEHCQLQGYQMCATPARELPVQSLHFDKAGPFSSIQSPAHDFGSVTIIRRNLSSESLELV